MTHGFLLAQLRADSVVVLWRTKLSSNRLKELQLLREQQLALASPFD